jgi:hypothetical protein
VLLLDSDDTGRDLTGRALTHALLTDLAGRHPATGVDRVQAVRHAEIRRLGRCPRRLLRIVTAPSLTCNTRFNRYESTRADCGGGPAVLAAAQLHVDVQGVRVVPSRHPAQSSTPARRAPLYQLADGAPSDTDYVLLGCFGQALTGTRSQRELCLVLHRAGYPGALARHLVRSSPLLVNVSGSCFRGHRYRLRRCCE